MSDRRRTSDRGCRDARRGRARSSAPRRRRPADARADDEPDDAEPHARRRDSTASRTLDRSERASATSADRSRSRRRRRVELPTTRARAAVAPPAAGEVPATECADLVPADDRRPARSRRCRTGPSRPPARCPRSSPTTPTSRRRRPRRVGDDHRQRSRASAPKAPTGPSPTSPTTCRGEHEQLGALSKTDRSTRKPSSPTRSPHAVAARGRAAAHAPPPPAGGRTRPRPRAAPARSRSRRHGTPARRATCPTAIMTGRDVAVVALVCFTSGRATTVAAGRGHRRRRHARVRKHCTSKRAAPGHAVALVAARRSAARRVALRHRRVSRVLRARRRRSRCCGSCGRSRPAGRCSASRARCSCSRTSAGSADSPGLLLARRHDGVGLAPRRRARASIAYDVVGYLRRLAVRPHADRARGLAEQDGRGHGRGHGRRRSSSAGVIVGADPPVGPRAAGSCSACSSRSARSSATSASR